MKKFTISLLAISISVLAQAQMTIKVGPELSGQFMTMTQKINGQKRDALYQPGAKIGAVVDLGITEHFFLQPGLALAFNHGSESTYTRNYSTGAGLPTSERDNRVYHVNYLQLPVLALYKSGEEVDSRFTLGGGPYLGVALGGRFEQRYTNTLNGVDITKRYDYSIPVGYERKDKIGTLDLGVQATAGYEMPFGLYFRIWYSVGLLNSAPNPDADNQFHHMGGGLSVGFLLNTDRGY